MPKSEMKIESEYMIPEETPVPARLDAVEVKAFQSKDRDTGALKFDRNGDPEMYDKWDWTFYVNDGPYAGVRINRLTEPYISMHQNNLVRHFAETLTGKVWREGEGLDTDDLIGLRCLLTVKHRPPVPKKDGSGMGFYMNIADIFPADALGDDKPPF